MKLVGRKTRKAIRKSVKKVVKKHGPEIAAGLVSGVASTLATLASTEAPRANSKRKKSNLSELSERVSDMLTDGNGKKPKDRRAARNTATRSKKK